MGVLEQITDMRNQGVSEDEIVTKLQEQGTSPKDINDALNQSKIKTAVSAETEGTGEMQPSVNPQGQNLPPKTQEMGGESGAETYLPAPQEEYAAPEEYYPQEGYGGYEGYGQEAGISTDTFIEIAEQVFAGKIKDIQKQLESLNEFKSLAQIKIDHIAERTKKIESTMDRLQAAILEKVGKYGGTLESIKKEMSMMQNSFGKMVGRAGTKHYAPVHKTAVPRKTIRKRKKTISRKK